MEPLLNLIMPYMNILKRVFLIIDSNRTMISGSRIGLLDIKALSIKEELSSEDKDTVIAYIKPPMIDPTD